MQLLDASPHEHGLLFGAGLFNRMDTIMIPTQ